MINISTPTSEQDLSKYTDVDPHRRRIVGVYGFAEEGTAVTEWRWTCPLCACTSQRDYESQKRANKAFHIHQERWCDES